LAESIKAAEERVANKLLKQAESAQANTGNLQLDKLIRAVQELADQSEQGAKDIAFKGIGCIQEDMFRLQQAEYFYVQGKREAYKEVMAIPARIIAESKLTLAE